MSLTPSHVIEMCTTTVINHMFEGKNNKRLLASLANGSQSVTDEHLKFKTE